MAKGQHPPRGDFEHRVLVGTMDFDLDDMWPDRTYKGLPLSVAYLYGTFFDEDGAMYVVVQQNPPHFTGGLMVFTNRDGGQLKIAQEARSAYKGALEIVKEQDSLVWRSIDYLMLGAATFEYKQTEQGSHWFEKGLLEIEGKMYHPGMQWYDPHPQGGGAYTCHVMRGSGTLLGKKVEGWYGYDFMFHPPGIIYTNSYLTQGGVEFGWLTLANEYEDGSWDIGMLSKGDQRWGFCIVANDKGEVSISNDIRSEIKQKENGFPESMRFMYTDENSGREENWFWDGHPQGELVDLPKVNPLNPTYYGGEATCTRVGENRPVKYGLAWTDFHNDGRIKKWNDEQGQ